MPKYIYSIEATARIREQWVIESPAPLTDEAAAEVIASGGDDAHALDFRSEEVIGEEERDPETVRFMGETA